MPTFQIGLQDGRSLQIEAVDQASALAGAQHFIAHGSRYFSDAEISKIWKR